MIQFPETARREWETIANAAKASAEVRKRIERDTLIDREIERLRIRHEAARLFQQELDADGTPTLEMVTLGTYQNSPAMVPADMIEGVAKENGLTTVLGPSGSGKSTLALQMLYSVMTGDPWLGQPVTKIDGGVGVLSYDMDAAMMLDWMAGFPNVDPSKVSVVNAYKRGNPLGVPAIRAQIAKAWQALNVEVVVLDSFSASFFGHDQNDAAATMAHYRDMKLFALTEVGAKALIVIAHSTAAAPNKARGSSVHADAADTMVSVVADPTTGKRTVDVQKYRSTRGQTQMDPVIVTAPDAVTHLVGLDLGEMALSGMKIPAAAMGAAAFTAMPALTAAPDIETYDDDEEEDDL